MSCGISPPIVIVKPDDAVVVCSFARSPPGTLPIGRRTSDRYSAIVMPRSAETIRADLTPNRDGDQGFGRIGWQSRTVLGSNTPGGDGTERNQLHVGFNRSMLPTPQPAPRSSLSTPLWTPLLTMLTPRLLIFHSTLDSIIDMLHSTIVDIPLHSTVLGCPLQTWRVHRQSIVIEP
jgi:hypothetical protein